MSGGQIFVFRVHGDQPLSVAVQQVDEALKQAVREGARKVLLDVRELTGFSRPDPFAISGMVRRWAASAEGRLKVAMVRRRDQMDPERLGVVVAHSIGFDVDAFDSEQEARVWLDLNPALWATPSTTTDRRE